MEERSEQHSGSAIPPQHSPGPWVYDPEFGEVVAGHREVAVPPTAMKVVAENIVAESVLRNNGPLIATAPDLLAELRRIVDYWARASLRLTEWESEELQRAMVLIAKTERREQ